MAKCEICGKGVTFGIKVSHSHRRTNRTWKPNVKRVKDTKKPEPSVILCSDFYYAACLPNVLLFSGGAKTELAPDDELSLFILLLLKPWSVLYIIS